MENYDFCGYATKNDLRCSDGRVIRKDAFACNDGETVSLVWNHLHNDPENILGHALLENRADGVYAYCSFNDTPEGQRMKKLVQHRDVTQLSIYANELQQRQNEVLHGKIREVSLVVSGANPGARIDSIIAHSDTIDEEAIIYTGEAFELFHADSEGKKEEKVAEPEKKENASSEKTVGDILDTLNDEQKTVVGYLIDQALKTKAAGDSDDDEDEDDEKKDVKHSGMEGEDNMKKNVFDVESAPADENVISHSDMMAVINDSQRYGSMRESALQHGITDIDYLFPDAKSLNNPPAFIKRPTEWVAKVMNATHHTPFSRIKSSFADITEDDARAKGYIKGNQKKEEVFSLLKRTTTPTTVYKLQKIDRDDVIDITDFDVVAWIKSEMRMMLDEELARAILVGDGRLASSDDKIQEANIRPVYNDADLYTIKTTVPVAADADEDTTAKAFIRSAIKARKDYRGSGSPVLYTTEDMLTSMLLLTDSMGRDLYVDEAQLAKKLRVSSIVTVPVMEGLTGANGGTLLGIIVNLSDYNVGADKGGAVNMFDDFDIDYNKQKYLIETRCSGALTVPYSAIALETQAASEET